jgi:hypothetical protein
MTDVFDGCLFIGSTSLFNEQFLSEKVDFSKRSMYGRAEFDLLKLRVLYQSKNNQERKNKYKNRPAPPVDRLTKPRRIKNGTNSQHTITGISKVA